MCNALLPPSNRSVSFPLPGPPLHPRKRLRENVQLLGQAIDM